ncbi:MAG: hypothetical protein ACE5GY_10985 [Thermodesulfobacteriota bacterium]
MSRRLPLCAWCGATLRRKAKVTIEWPDEAGRPFMGWHIGCEWKDPCFRPLLDGGPFINAMMVVRARGTGRVAMNKIDTEEVSE